MLEQIIENALYASSIVFLAYKWRKNFWRCDFCAGYWLSVLLHGKYFLCSPYILPMVYALPSAIVAYLITTNILSKYDNHNFTGRY